MISTSKGYQVGFASLPDLAAEAAGGKVLAANDEFFAPKENLLHGATPIFIADKYTENGKWMDGWETRRRRSAGFDWCVVKLGMPGRIDGVNIDTAFFVGNFPEYASLEALAWTGKPDSVESAPASAWVEILSKSRLRGGVENFFAIESRERWTHLRLKIYPDGGVARLRVHGEVLPDWKQLSQPFDLAALENGGTVAACNDSFFGPKDNLILPGRAQHMGQGWETRRRRRPGNDWIVVRLGQPGILSRVEVDTHHFKGNFPEACSLEGVALPPSVSHTEDFFSDIPIDWVEILPRVKLQADHRHVFEKELRASAVVTHVRLSIYPDGGVSRLRLFGKLHAPA